MERVCEKCGETNAKCCLWKNDRFVFLCFECYKKDGLRRLESMMSHE